MSSTAKLRERTKERRGIVRNLVTREKKKKECSKTASRQLICDDLRATARSSSREREFCVLVFWKAYGVLTIKAGEDDEQPPGYKGACNGIRGTSMGSAVAGGNKGIDGVPAEVTVYETHRIPARFRGAPRAAHR